MNTLKIINTETHLIPEVSFEYFTDFATHRLKQMETGQILTEKGVKYSYATIRIYKATIALFKEFELLLQSKIKIHEMNGRTVKAFVRYLTSKDLSLNSIKQYISKIKAIGNFLFAEDIGLKPVKHSVKSEKQPQVYLSISELQQITNCETLTEGERKVLDVFLIQCFTGMRLETVKIFLKNPFAYMKEHEGNSYIDIVANKTGEQCVIPLSVNVSSIITKYGGRIEVNDSVHMNKYIKRVCRKAGIDNPVPVRITKGGELSETLVPKYQKITTNTSRRTFSTIIRKYVNNDEAVTKMTGHTSVAQLSTYIQSTKVDEILPYLNNEFFNIEI